MKRTFGTLYVYPLKKMFHNYDCYSCGNAIRTESLFEVYLDTTRVVTPPRGKMKHMSFVGICFNCASTEDEAEELANNLLELSIL